MGLDKNCINRSRGGFAGLMEQRFRVCCFMQPSLDHWRRVDLFPGTQRPDGELMFGWLRAKADLSGKEVGTFGEDKTAEYERNVINIACVKGT